MEDKTNEIMCPQCGWVEGNAPESALHLPPGTVLQEKYLIGKALGQGGFGITYLAWDKTLNIKLAIKEYLPQELAYRSGGQSEISIFKESLAGNFNYGLEKFLEEARTLAQFNEHPNIVSVRVFFKANGTAYLVMNHIEGVTLKEYLAGRDKPLPFDQALDIFMPVLDALKEVHAAGILHRDISPDNLLIDRSGRVVLIDFGAARQAMGDKSRSMSVIMKAGYSPLEQYQSKGKQGPWTDIYAVAATFYHIITGQMPPEPIDRITSDDLITPIELSAYIDRHAELALLKGLEIYAEDRFQTVEEFQITLMEGERKNSELKTPETERCYRLGKKAVIKKISKSDSKYKGKEAIASKKRLSARKHEGKMGVIKKKGAPVRNHWSNNPENEAIYSIQKSNKALTSRVQNKNSKEQLSLFLNGNIVKNIVLGVLCLLLLIRGISYFSGEVGFEPNTRSEPGDLDQVNQGGSFGDSDFIHDLNADYYIDYKNGTIPIGDLPIGARVVDPSWEWEFRTGRNYTLETRDETKPVTWLISAKDHYVGLEPHVTLLSEELIGRFPFDNSTERGSYYGYNHWGESCTSNASHSLRAWLNSIGTHSDEGFYQAFSDNFKSTALITIVPNKEWEKGTAYSTEDHVYLPSNTELGDSAHYRTYPIGNKYPYFSEAGDANRTAQLDGEEQWYWTRSPDSNRSFYIRSVSTGDFTGNRANHVNGGVRPVINIKSETLVSEVMD